jgi:hypothetical protein
MSASSMPQVGPAMICASSITLIPFNGPIAAFPCIRATAGASLKIIDESNDKND